MKNILQHKGYTGNVQFDQDDMLFYGRVIGMRKAIIAYEGKTVDDLVKDFQAGVDDYLDMCVEEGKEPEKPFKGTFNIRLDPDLHERLVKGALSEGVTLNAYIKDVLAHAVSDHHV